MIVDKAKTRTLYSEICIMYKISTQLTVGKYNMNEANHLKVLRKPYDQSLISLPSEILRQ